MGARKMVKLKVEETSGVDHPAHLEEGWIVMKSAAKGVNVEKKQTRKADKEELLDRLGSYAKAEDGMEDDDTEMEKEDEVDDEDVEMEKAEDEDEEVDFEAMFAKMKEERDLYKGKYDKMYKKYGSSDDADEEMEKAAPPAVREMLKKARNEAAEARAALRDEVDARKDREYVAKAVAWNALSIDAEIVGHALRKMADVDADITKTIMAALSSANAQADAANIFAELGTAKRPDSGSAYSRMTKMAKSAVEAGEHKTIEQAISALVLSNPELYDAYRQENN